MTRARYWLSQALHLLAVNPNASVFTIGLSVLCASVAQWSGPLAGAIAGAVLMLVALWPFVAPARRSQD